MESAGSSVRELSKTLTWRDQVEGTMELARQIWRWGTHDMNTDTSPKKYGFEEEAREEWLVESMQGQEGRRGRDFSVLKSPYIHQNAKQTYPRTPEPHSYLRL